jgi:hypothetical protein
MDFFSVRQNIKLDEWDEEIYTEEDDEQSFAKDLRLAIRDECGFNVIQSREIYDKAYQESHSNGYESIVNTAQELSYFVRLIINLE